MQKTISNNKAYDFLEEYINKDFEEKIDNALEKVKEKYRWAFYFKPLLLFYGECLYKVINGNNLIIEKEKFFENTLLEICDILHEPSFRVIISEINTLREEKKLKGDSPKERGAYYSNVLLKDKEYISDVYKRYPELTRILDIFVQNEVKYISDILEETKSEFLNICNEFDLDVNDKLVSLDLSAGDTHNGGKTVGVLNLASGEKVIYKPRNLETDEGYNKFLEYINNRNIENFYNLEGVKVYSNKNKTAGWVKFIKYKECKTQEEVKGFYYRIGEILCILHLFHSTDFHYENIIAQGDVPVLIDLETILNPKIYDSIYDNSAKTEADKFITDSVEKCGLIPRKTINKNNKLVDIGGLSAAEKQESRLKALCIEGYDTDEVRLVRKYIEIKPKDNNPKLKGKIVKSEEYIDEIKQMENGDIPYFSVNTSNTNIYSGTPSVINNVYDKSILEMVNDNIEMFNEVNLEKQIAILNVAYYGGITESVSYETGIDFNKDSKIRGFSNEDALKAASSIGEYILRKSIKGKGNNGEEMTWLR